MSPETKDQDLKVRTTVEVGSEAPDFEMRDHEGQMVKLSDFRGTKNVLLAFYPDAFSPGCDLEVLGVSVDPVWSLKAWKSLQKFVNRFLSDFWPHGAVSQAYGAFSDKFGVSLRHAFLIDKQGVVRYVERNGAGELPDQEIWRKAITELE